MKPALNYLNTETWVFGAFHLTKNSCLQLREFPVANGTVFSGIRGKEDNLARYTEILWNFLPGISVPFDFPPGISGVLGWMIRFSEIQQFPDFLETFSGNFRTICPRFEIFGHAKAPPAKKDWDGPGTQLEFALQIFFAPHHHCTRCLIARFLLSNFA